MPQCVSEMVQVSNLYLQRGGAKFQFSVSFMEALFTKKIVIQKHSDLI